MNDARRPAAAPTARRLALAAALSAACCLASCAGSGRTNDPGAQPPATLGEAAITIDRAIEIARAERQGDVIEIEAEPRGWGTKYEVAILKPDGAVAEIKIDGRDGTVMQIEDPRQLSPDEQARVDKIAPFLADLKISFSDAFRAARAKHPSGWAKGVEIEVDHAEPNYEVEIFENSEWVRVEVDGRTGEVEKFRRGS